MKIDVIKGTTSKLIEIFISDSSKTDGDGLTGIAFGDITGYYYRSGAAAVVELAALKTMTLGTWVTEGFIEVDAVNMPGYYQLGLPDVALIAGVNQVNFLLKGATNMAPLPLEIQLIDPIAYEGGIWVDSGAANTNTVPGTDGLRGNPVSTLVAARTLADAIGVKKYYIVNDSTLTLAASHLNWEFIGIGLRNQIDLGSQNVNDSFFYHIVISGTQGGNQKIESDCSYLNGVVDLNVIATNCWLTGNNTLKASTLSIIDHWSSNVPGESTPELTFQAGETSIGLRHGSGGIKVKSMTSDHTMSLETKGQLIVDSSCSGGAISARGNMSITDNAEERVTITKDAVYNKSEVLDAIVNDSIQFSGADIGSIKTVTDNLADSATTIVSAAAVVGTLSITQMTTDLTEITDDHYNGRIIIWTLGVLQDQATDITDYDGGTKMLTFTAVTDIPSDGDTFVIV